MFKIFKENQVKKKTCSLKLDTDGFGDTQLIFVDDETGERVGIVGSFYEDEGYFDLHHFLKENLIVSGYDTSGMKFNKNGSLLTKGY